MIGGLLFVLISMSSLTVTFNKVIIWGHKLHSHTHSYIHNAFFRAFQHLGYQTHWLDNNDNIADFDLSNSLFITEGQVDQKIPLRNDCRYILHNCTSPKYGPFLNQGKAITLQVYTDDVLSRPVTKIDDFIYYDLAEKCIYMPWATDLLPHEIDAVKKRLPRIKKDKKIWWVGSIADGEFGNINELLAFKKACDENHIPLIQGKTLSVTDNMELVQHSYLAPAIVGTWQQKVGYIPCRIFKNISYGQMGITNSWHVYELFKRKIVYNPNPYQLFYDAEGRLKTLSNKELFQLMDFVKNKHTYINRIKALLSFLNQVGKTYGSA